MILMIGAGDDVIAFHVGKGEKVDPLDCQWTPPVRATLDKEKRLSDSEGLPDAPSTSPATLDDAILQSPEEKPSQKKRKRAKRNATTAKRQRQMTTAKRQEKGVAKVAQLKEMFCSDINVFVMEEKLKEAYKWTADLDKKVLHRICEYFATAHLTGNDHRLDFIEELHNRNFSWFLSEPADPTDILMDHEDALRILEDVHNRAPYGSDSMSHCVTMTGHTIASIHKVMRLSLIGSEEFLVKDIEDIIDFLGTEETKNRIGVMIEAIEAL